jgi:phage tail-like protein
MAKQEDPVVSAWFGIEFQGQIDGAFRECTGLGSENEVVTYLASGEKGEHIIKKVPGRTKYNNITLKRGVTKDTKLWQWRKLVEQGDMGKARKNGAVVMFNPKGEEIARWEFFNAWPCKLTGPNGNANANEPAIEELEITHEEYHRKT